MLTSMFHSRCVSLPREAPARMRTTLDTGLFQLLQVTSPPPAGSPFPSSTSLASSRGFARVVGLSKVVAICRADANIADAAAIQPASPDHPHSFWVAGQSNAYGGTTLMLVTVTRSGTATSPSAMNTLGLRIDFDASSIITPLLQDSPCGMTCALLSLATHRYTTVKGGGTSAGEAATSVIYFVAGTSANTYFGRFTWNTTARQPVPFRLQVAVKASATVTALLLDSFAQQGYIALNTADGPTAVYRFDMETCIVIGQSRFNVVGADREIALGFAVRSDTRSVNLLVPLGQALRVVELSLFAVTDVTPEFADTQGGTTVTVAGTGFVSGQRCSFGGREVPLQQYFNSTMVTCLAPSGGSESCSGETVEMMEPWNDG